MKYDYEFEDYKTSMICSTCKKTHIVSTIINFNMAENENLKASLKNDIYGDEASGTIAFKPICIYCECYMNQTLKLEFIKTDKNHMTIKTIRTINEN